MSNPSEQGQRFEIPSEGLVIEVDPYVGAASQSPGVLLTFEADGEHERVVRIPSREALRLAFGISAASLVAECLVFGERYCLANGAALADTAKVLDMFRELGDEIMRGLGNITGG